MTSNHLEQVRRFNRLVTARAGALDKSYLGRGRSLGEARVLFEIGPQGCPAALLRETLALDSGYFSRVLRTLEAQGLIAVVPDTRDRRRRALRLTDKGKAEWAAYDALSDRLAASLLRNLDQTRQARLAHAMNEVERLMTAAEITVDDEPPDSAAAKFCLDAYFRELADRFEESFDPDHGGAAEDAAMTPPEGCFLVARLHGRAIGCGGLKTLGDGLGEIKRMWVAPEARGLGVARRLLAALEDAARTRAMGRIRLDTNRSLTQAQALYRSAGYRAIERYNDNPYADFWFEKDLPASG